MTEISGRCLCGDVRYRVTGDVRDAFYCHCEDCRRSAGAPFVAWGRVDEDRFTLSGGAVDEFRSSPKVTRTRCRRCGTEICYRHADEAPGLDFLLATLDAPDGVRPTFHVQTAEKLAWVELSDDLPKYARWRGKGS